MNTCNIKPPSCGCTLSGQIVMVMGQFAIYISSEVTVIPSRSLRLLLGAFLPLPRSPTKLHLHLSQTYLSIRLMLSPREHKITKSVQREQLIAEK